MRPSEFLYPTQQSAPNFSSETNNAYKIEPYNQNYYDKLCVSLKNSHSKPLQGVKVYICVCLYTAMAYNINGGGPGHGLQAKTGSTTASMTSGTQTQAPTVRSPQNPVEDPIEDPIGGHWPRWRLPGGTRCRPARDLCPAGSRSTPPEAAGPPQSPAMMNGRESKG